jgi:uncharacterized PurR-regulated membrane protein YhhQ (DUF165 family)
VKTAGTIALIAYAATIIVANWLVANYGLVPVGFGLVAPAGVYAAGFAFTFRDVAHRTLGRNAVILAIAAGAALSAYVSPALALASAAAFIVSELADLTVYEPLARRRWTLAVVCSNAVGIVIDSALFLWLAFGSLAFFDGQVVGKAWTTLVAVAVIAGSRAFLPRHA